MAAVPKSFKERLEECVQGNSASLVTDPDQAVERMGQLSFVCERLQRLLFLFPSMDGISVHAIDSASGDPLLSTRAFLEMYPVEHICQFVCLFQVLQNAPPNEKPPYYCYPFLHTVLLRASSHYCSRSAAIPECALLEPDTPRRLSVRPVLSGGITCSKLTSIFVNELPASHFLINWV